MVPVAGFVPLVALIPLLRVLFLGVYTMKKNVALLLVLAAIAIASAAIAQQPGRQGGGNRPGNSLPVISGCMVSLINEAQVPGQEAGVLIELKATEGQQVKDGELVSQIDDSQPRMQGRVAQAEHRAAEEKAKSTVDIRYATKASEVALKEFEKSKEANRSTKGSVSEVEVERQRLTYERGVLEIERAKFEQKIAGFTADAKKVEIDAAVEAMKRREIRSPVDGMVQQVHLHRGEWVKPGDPVLHVVQLDRLKVEGYVDFAVCPSSDHRSASHRRSHAARRRVTFKGQITFVSPLIEGVGDSALYRVKAEVENRQEDGLWLLLPGLFVDMKIQAK